MTACLSVCFIDMMLFIGIVIFISSGLTMISNAAEIGCLFSKCVSGVWGIQLCGLCFSFMVVQWLLIFIGCGFTGDYFGCLCS